MTDRVRQLVVQLDCDYRTDDVRDIIRAIRMIKGVADVGAGEFSSIKDEMTRNQIKNELADKVLEILRPTF